MQSKALQSRGEDFKSKANVKIEETMFFCKAKLCTKIRDFESKASSKSKRRGFYCKTKFCKRKDFESKAEDFKSKAKEFKTEESQRLLKSKKQSLQCRASSKSRKRSFQCKTDCAKLRFAQEAFQLKSF